MKALREVFWGLAEAAATRFIHLLVHFLCVFICSMQGLLCTFRADANKSNEHCMISVFLSSIVGSHDSITMRLKSVGMLMRKSKSTKSCNLIMFFGMRSKTWLSQPPRTCQNSLPGHRFVAGRGRGFPVTHAVLDDYNCY